MPQRERSAVFTDEAASLFYSALFIFEYRAGATIDVVGGDIMDEDEGALKENLIATVAAPSEVITADVVAVDGPKEKSAASADEAYYLFSSNPLYQETEPVPPFMVEEEDNTK